MDVTDSFDEIFNRSVQIQNSFLEQISNFDSDAYFRAKYFKASRFEILKKTFNRNGMKLILGKNFCFEQWRDIGKFINVEQIEFIDSDFFITQDSESDFINKCEFLKGKVVITTNHDICRSDFNVLNNLKKFFVNCNETLFCGWDWDNHHNLAISLVYALYSDIYFPSQRDNQYELSRVTHLNHFIAPSAYEWDREFLTSNLSTIFNSERAIDIFGTFNFYSRFPYRNQVIQTLSGQIPEIRFIGDFSEYTTKTQDEKLKEWCNAKWHWLVPTLNAVSVRAFYALITGVGVILPIEFRSFSEFENLDERDVVWYTVKDVLDTSRVKAEALQKYNESGLDGVIRRHRFALDHHNLDCRVREMVSVVSKYLKH